jgi:hypothetical protein
MSLDVLSQRRALFSVRRVILLEVLLEVGGLLAGEPVHLARQLARRRLRRPRRRLAR